MRRTSATCSLLLIATAAMAHPGHEAIVFAAGFAHPWGGADHLIAMLAVGLLAVRLRAWWLPLAFMGGMALGGMLAAAGVAMPLAEPAITASLIAIGATLALARPPRAAFAAALIAAVAVPHGWAHVAEAGGALGGYAAGFLLATLLLHAIGVGAGACCREAHARLLRWGGWATAAAGAVLAIA